MLEPTFSYLSNVSSLKYATFLRYVIERIALTFPVDVSVMFGTVYCLKISL